MLGNVVNYLATKGIKISTQNEWLVECYNCCAENDPHISNARVNESVYEQWLLANLRDIGEGCIPNNINEVQKTVLRGRFALQVDNFLNVGESSYSQLQKIRNTANKNLDIDETVATRTWEPKPSRMLKLTLTDGVNVIYGMEYKPIPLLRDPFIPGVKVIITGPVECRRGVLLLEPGHIQLLGGESDDLLVCNAVENILARRLNLDQNPTPYKDILVQSNQFHGNDDVSQPENVSSRSTQQVSNNLIDNTVPAEFIDSDDDMLLCDHVDQIENTYSQVNNDGLSNIPLQTSTATIDTRITCSTESNRTNTAFQNGNLGCLSETVRLRSANITTPMVIDNSFISSNCSAKSSVQCDIKTFKIPSAVRPREIDIGSGTNPTSSSNDNIARRTDNDDVVLDVDCSVTSFKRRSDSLATLENERESFKVSSSVRDPFVSKGNFKMFKSDNDNCTPKRNTTNTSFNSALTDDGSGIALLGKNCSNMSDNNILFGSVSNIDNTGDNKSAITTGNKNDSSSGPLMISKLSDVIVPPDARVITPGAVVYFHGYVQKLTSNPRIRNASWKLTGVISDDTANVEVSFCNDLLEKIFDYNSAQMVAEKDIVSKNVALQQKTLQILKQGRKKLLALRGRMKVKFLDNEEMPVVLDIITQ